MTAPSDISKFINNLLFNLNILTIAIVTGLVANKAKAATDSYLNSNGPVIESGHIAILVDQWSDAVPPLLRQLRIAAADPRADAALRRPVLLLTGRPKAQAEALIRDAAAGATAGGERRLEVLVRQGDPRLPADAARVCAARAAHVALLAADADRAAPAGPAVRRRVAAQAALLRQLRRGRAPGAPAALLSVPQPAAPGGWGGLRGDFTLVEDEEFVGRLLGVLARPSQASALRVGVGALVAPCRHPLPTWQSLIPYANGHRRAITDPVCQRSSPGHH
jgi:hypothetical protein